MLTPRPTCPPGWDRHAKLSLFVLEPLRWTERFGWRDTTPAERDALFMYWRRVGERMGIGGVPESLEKMAEESEEYERSEMKYSEDNPRIGDTTIALMLSVVPGPARGIARWCVYAMLDDRLRRAMDYPSSPKLLTVALHAALKLRALVRARAWPSQDGRRLALQDPMLTMRRAWPPATLTAQIIRWLMLPRRRIVRRTPPDVHAGTGASPDGVARAPCGALVPLFNLYRTGDGSGDYAYADGYHVNDLGNAHPLP